MTHSYETLARRLIHQIESGQFQADEKLPSVRALAAQYQLSAATAVRCYRELASLGWVRAKPRSGYVVARTALPPERTKELSLTSAAPVEYEKLVSLEHRMSQLYELTRQPISLGLHLATADPSWYPNKSLARMGQQRLRQDEQLLGTYPTGNGLPQLREALARWLAQTGMNVSADELLITHGSTEALSVALQAVVPAGGAVLVESPVYFGLLQTLSTLGLRAIEIPSTPESGISLEAVEFALEHQSGIKAMVVMPSFQNPLGSCMSDAAKRQLLRLAERYDFALIEDDVFGDLSHLPERPKPIKAWDQSGRVIYYSSCSKSIAPGLRLGWLAGGRFHARIAAIKLSQSLVTPLLEQAMLADYLESGQLHAHLAQLRRRLAANIPKAQRAIARYFPLECQLISPAGGWWLWLALPAHVNALQLLERAIGLGIAFSPGLIFSNTSKYSHCMRINIGRPWTHELEQGLKLLGEQVQVMAHAPRPLTRF